RCCGGNYWQSLLFRMDFAGRFLFGLRCFRFDAKAGLCGGRVCNVTKSGNFARDPRSLCRASRAAVFALNLGLLAVCAQWPDGRVVSTGPDVVDRVRSLDLLPRFPQQPAPRGQNVASGAKAQVYEGVTIPAVEGAQPRPTPGGEGYELNFE